MRDVPRGRVTDRGRLRQSPGRQAAFGSGRILDPGNPATIGNVVWWVRGDYAVLSGTLRAAGTTPPAVLVSGDLNVPQGVRVEITDISGGAGLGQAKFRVSINNGTSWVAEDVTTAATYPITGTGKTLTFPEGTYATDNVYVAVVATWSDLGPFGLDFTDGATASRRPDYILADANIGSKPSLSWHAASAAFLTTVVKTTVPPLTYAFVFRCTDNTAARCLYSNAPLTPFRRQALFTTATNLRILGTSTPQLNITVTSVTDDTMLLYLEFSTAAAAAYRSGTSIGSGAIGVNAGTLGERIGASGFDDTGAVPWRGTIAEGVAFSRHLSAASRDSFEAYVGARYTITMA